LKPLDYQTYLKAKAVGDNSMSEKAELGKAVAQSVRRSPGDKVKPTLVKPQFPRCKMIGSDTTADIRCSPIPGGNISPGNNVSGSRVASATRRKRTRHLNHPNVHYARNARSPNGGDPYGDGASVVVRERESRSHGEGRQANRVFSHGGTCDA